MRSVLVHVTIIASGHNVTSAWPSVSAMAEQRMVPLYMPQ